jgi:CBS domain-containing protein
MKAGELCVRDVIVADTASGVKEIAGLMREFHVGDIVIVKDRETCREPVGIVTDRDIVIELIARDTPVEACSAGDIMSSELYTAREDEPVWQVIQSMRDKGVRRVPVIDSGNCLVGILSWDDVIDFLAEEMKAMASLSLQSRRREEKSRR